MKFSSRVVNIAVTNHELEARETHQQQKLGRRAQAQVTSSIERHMQVIKFDSIVEEQKPVC